VIKMEGNAGFAAMMWNFDQATSLNICRQFRADGATCYVLPNTTIQQIAQRAPLPDVVVDAGTDQGSDTEKAKPSAAHKKGRVRKVLH